MILRLKKKSCFHYRLILFVSLLLSFSVFGCAARQKLDTYPQRHIDRPYTLPKGINYWKTTIYYGHWKDNEYDGKDYFVPNPFYWNQPITDNLNLIWSPLPFALQYQFVNTQKHTFGTSAGISELGYASDGDWSFDLFISGDYKYKLSDSTAIINKLTFEESFGFDDYESWGVDFQCGPLFQIRDNLAVTPFFHLSVDRADNWYYSLDDEDEKNRQEETKWSFPISLGIDWSLNQQLDLNVTYTYSALGYSNDYVGHHFTTSIVHFW